MNEIHGEIFEQQQPLDEKDLIRCNSCGYAVFTQGMVVKKVSALLSSSGSNELQPVLMMQICAKCGDPLEPPGAENDPDFIKIKKMIAPNKKSSIIE